MVVAVCLVGFLQQQVAGAECVGIAPEVTFQVLCRRANVFGRGRDDSVQVLPQAGRLFRAVKDLQHCMPLHGQFFFAHPTQEVMDAVGEDPIPYAGSCFEQAYQVPVQLDDVARDR